MGRKKSLNTLINESIKELTPYLENMDEEKKRKLNKELKNIKAIAKGGKAN